MSLTDFFARCRATETALQGYVNGLSVDAYNVAYSLIARVP